MITESTPQPTSREILPPDFRDEIKEAEQFILGEILWDPQLLETAKIRLSPDSFRYERHRIIFRAMIELRDDGKAINVLTLWEHLKESGEIDKIGGSSYLTYLPQIVIEERVKMDEIETNTILAWINREGVATNGQQ